MTIPSNVFDGLADCYDAWFDSDMGRAVFPAEVESSHAARA